MPRITATVDEDQKQWVEAEADDRGVAEAQVIRELIDDARGDDSETLADRVAELEARVDNLEADRSTSDASDAAARSGSEADGEAWRSTLLQWLREEGVDKKRHGDVMDLAELLEREQTLSRDLAVNQQGVVSSWEWQESKDILAASPVADRIDQNTWRWVG